MGGGRGKWEGTRVCPVCKKTISKRGFAWRKHEATHPQLVAARRRAAAVFQMAYKLAVKDG